MDAIAQNLLQKHRSYFTPCSSNIACRGGVCVVHQVLVRKSGLVERNLKRTLSRSGEVTDRHALTLERFHNRHKKSIMVWQGDETKDLFPEKVTHINLTKL